MTTSSQPQFTIQRLYLKDITFRTPDSPVVLGHAWQPELNLNLNTRTRLLDERHHEVALTAKLVANNAGETVFMAEVEQAGIFVLVDFPEAQQQAVLGSLCPSILFPYVREQIDNLVVKGGFPAPALAPVNFEALYQQQAQASEAGTDVAEAAH